MDSGKRRWYENFRDKYREYTETEKKGRREIDRIEPIGEEKELEPHIGAISIGDFLDGWLNNK